MMESNPYFAVSSGSSGSYNPYDHTGGFPPVAFPVVRLRGLPFNCTDVDIFKFFPGLEIVDLLLVNKDGRFSGDAFVVFSRPIQADLAVQKNRQNMGRRYVEVFKCKKQEYYYAVAAELGYEGGYYDYDYRASPPRSRSKKVKDKEQKEYTEILKLRGLPFTVQKADIVEFFKDFNVADEKVHIACRPDGKPDELSLDLDSNGYEFLDRVGIFASYPSFKTFSPLSSSYTNVIIIIPHLTSMDSAMKTDKLPPRPPLQLQHHELPQRPIWQIIMVAAIAAGVQFEWALQLSLLTPYVQLIGVPHTCSSFIWLCGPISGMIVQPLVGYYSNSCTSRFGRRRPFIAGVIIIYFSSGET
ncbi:hypothetical protein E3N88_02274 [Mikania micrantha]|uniref:RRM domain-containing protein n=1 Tax=Mikania micrantha TaxID=192012 RepID=A0A5N6Q5J9_9ASTR|nr:hypothetical protein E3N88_02274 [Mikania micrantha]